MTSYKELRIIFFGTPDFAVASLRALVDAGANIVAVVTSPDKPAGRGRQVQMSAVKRYALDQGLPLLQPVKLKSETFLTGLRALKADLQVVVAFRMMPEAVWNMPPLGTINVHASLLPDYRGAAPISWAIINGETETGVTTFKLKHEIDTGDILLQKKVAILPDDNAGTLHDKLMREGADLLLETVKGIAEHSLQEIPQDTSDTSRLRHAPKLFREHMEIDWNRTTKQVRNHIRGLSPYPAAFTTLAGKTIKIYRSHAIPDTEMPAPGTCDTDKKTFLRFAAKDGWIYIDELQQEGKKRMGIEEYLRGFRS